MDTKKELHPIIKELISIIKVVIFAMILSLFMRKYIVTNAYVPSGSMEPTIKADSNILLNRLAYVSKEPERGDIVAFPFPDNEDELYLKRIIGLPGETIEGIDGCVYVNGVKLENDFSDIYIFNDFGPFTVPENSYFMMGDNRNNSLDSRYWNHTYVSKDDIIGKAVMIIHPEIKFVE